MIPFLLVLGLTSGIAASGTVGLVAETRGEAHSDGKALDVLDDLHEDQVVKVSNGSRIVLLYFSGCTRETVQGPAELKIGKLGSKPKDKSAITSEHTRCEAPGMAPSSKVGSVPGALVLMGKKKDNGKEYQDEVNSHPEDSSARLAYAIYLANRGQNAEALEQYENLVRLNPGSAALRARRDALATHKDK